MYFEYYAEKLREGGLRRTARLRRPGKAAGPDRMTIADRLAATGQALRRAAAAVVS